MLKSVRVVRFLLVTLAISTSLIQSAFALRKIPASIRSADRSAPAAACWDAIHAVGGCQDEIDMAMKNNEIEVSYDCCRVILYELPEKCAGEVFSYGGEFSPEISGAVNEYCDGMGITPPVLKTDDKIEKN